MSLCFGLSNAQSISSDFPDSNYFYNESRYSRLSDMFPEYNSIEYTIYYKKDTSVNNINYQLLNLKYQTKYLNPPMPSVSKDIPYALLRNDKLNKKVYIIGLNNLNEFHLDLDTNERLLFDFDLNIGDKYTPNAHLYYHVDSLQVLNIDTIIDPDNIKRAVYTIGINNLTFNGILIQGIGGTNGLLGYIADVMDNSYFEVFDCYNINDTSYTATFNSTNAIISYSIAQCNERVFLSVNNNEIDQISLYPNPTNTTFYINYNDPNTTFELLNSIGQSEKVKGNYDGGKWSFKIDDLENGVYILKISSKGNIFYNKIYKI